MDTPTLINIMLCILSFILAAISVITVVITLRQNNRMIDNSTRPYVVVYSVVTNFQTPDYYICVKNFGQSGTVITKFTCDVDLKKYSYHKEHIPFEHLSNTFIAPGQSFICNLDPIELFKEVHPLTFDIEYKSNGKHYTNTFTINIQADSDLIHTRASTKDKELCIISYTLQDIAEKLL